MPRPTRSTPSRPGIRPPRARSRAWRPRASRPAPAARALAAPDGAGAGQLPQRGITVEVPDAVLPPVAPAAVPYVQGAAVLLGASVLASIG